MNPVLVEVLRGETVESSHRGALAVLDADGGVLASLGDIDRPAFPRSAVKLLQALPLVESGAAERLGLTDAELALTCASHNGEEVHVRTAAGMLAKAGLYVAALALGAVSLSACEHGNLQIKSDPDKALVCTEMTRALDADIEVGGFILGTGISFRRDVANDIQGERRLALHTQQTINAFVGVRGGLRRPERHTFFHRRQVRRS